YIVRAGDTACEVAEQFSMRCAELFALNKLDKRGTIYRGQRLILSAAAQKVKASAEWTVGNSTETQPGSQTVLHDSSERYFFTHENFYVITRYNQSVLYAMAVYDLSQAIELAMQRRGV
ncbi:MAG: lytic murein transglycosylase, partial [Arenicella sp.]|nr:lytic murein transglycosylase [Arenicella sp.]